MGLEKGQSVKKATEDEEVKMHGKTHQRQTDRLRHRPRSTQSNQLAKILDATLLPSLSFQVYQRSSVVIASAESVNM